MSLEVLFAFKHHQPSGYNFKLHKHAYHEFIFFLKGMGETNINSMPYEYKAMDICFTRQGDTRDHKARRRTVFICIGFYGDLSDEMKSGIYSGKKAAEILPAVLEIQKEFMQKLPEYQGLCNLKMQEILLKLLRINMKQITKNSIQGLIKRIDSDKIYNMRVEEMAKELSYSYDYFRHEFKRQTGLSPKTYLMKNRIAHAKVLLTTEDYSCTLISEICGFSTSAQFTSIFKKETGLTPMNYRKCHKNT